MSKAKEMAARSPERGNPEMAVGESMLRRFEARRHRRRQEADGTC